MTRRTAPIFTGGRIRCWFRGHRWVGIIGTYGLCRCGRCGRLSA